MTTRRLTRDLCEDCHLDVRPTEYAPYATREGTCGRCGADAYVSRSTIADEMGPAAVGPCYCNAMGNAPHAMGSTGCAYEEVPA